MKEENLEKFRKSLSENQLWPSVYMFKMIFPASHRSFALVSSYFPEGSELTVRNSESGKYMIATVQEMMLSADEVISRYQLLLTIEGMILL